MTRMSEVWQKNIDALRRIHIREFGFTKNMPAWKVERVSLMKIARDKCKENEDEKITVGP